MAKYVLFKSVHGDIVTDYELLQEVGMNSYIIMNDDGTADMDLGMGQPIKASVENGSFVVGDDSLSFTQDDKTIEVNLGDEQMLFVEETKLPEFIAESQDADSAAKEQRMAELKAKLDAERQLKPRRYTHLGTISLSKAGKQTTKKAKAPSVVSFYGDGEGEHPVDCEINGLGEGVWRESDIFTGEYEIEFGDKNFRAKFTEDGILYLSDDADNHHCLEDAKECPFVEKNMWKIK
ncbi:MAG: hypothetical protein HUJ96_01385 [Marinilabiliaceae bacterium]|nr:hypothetical protein [Marinilabiliaceae bacterium]